MKWEPKRAMNDQQMKAIEARTESAGMVNPIRFSGWRTSKFPLIERLTFPSRRIWKGIKRLLKK